MPISSFLLGLTLAILVVPFLAQPFLRRAGQGGTLKTAGAPAGEALTKAAALVALRDLDFDFNTGKITEADYAPLRQQLLGAAAQAAQQENVRTGAEHDEAAADSAADEAIERAVQAHRLGRDRRRHHQPSDAVHDDAIESSVLSLRRSSPAAVPICPECGSPADSADRFCHGCGAALGQTCPACQSPVDATDRFCGHCGANLNEKVVFAS